MESFGKFLWPCWLAGHYLHDLRKVFGIYDKLKISKDLAIAQIIENYALSNEEAAALVNSNW